MRRLNVAVAKNGWLADTVENVPTTAFALIAGMAVGLVAATLPLMGTAVIFAGLVALMVGIARPEWALYLYVSGVVVMAENIPAGIVDSFLVPDVDLPGLPSALTTFFLLIFAITVIRLLIFERRKPPVRLLPVAVITLIIGVGLVTGFLRGGDPELYRIDFTGMLFPVLMFCLCLTLLDSREKIGLMIDLLLALSAIKALIQAGYYLVGLGWTYQFDRTTVSRITTMDSADLLVYITLPLVVIHRLVRGDLRGCKAALSAAACVPMLYVVIFSYRRAQWVGLILSVGLLWLGSSKAVRHKMSLLLLTVLLLGSATAVTLGLDADKVAHISSRITSIFDSKQSSNVYHMVESQRVLQDLAGSPILGLGLGSHHSPVGLYEDDGIPTNIVHNAFLYVWMKIGLPGLLFYLWAAICFFRQVLRFRRQHIESYEWGFVLPLAASSGLWLAMFLTGPVPWYLQVTGLIALFAAMAVSLMKQAGRELSSEGGAE